MSLSILFWVLWIVTLIFGAYSNRANFPGWFGGSFVQFLLIGILGWAVFGPAVR